MNGVKLADLPLCQRAASPPFARCALAIRDMIPSDFSSRARMRALMAALRFSAGSTTELLLLSPVGPGSAALCASLRDTLTASFRVSLRLIRKISNQEATVNMPRLGPILSGSALGILALCITSRNVRAQAFVQTNLVSDVPGLAANTDPNLKNPWGISFSATSPFWVSDAGTGKATLYNSSGTPQALVVTIPALGGVGTAVPTGQVFNSSSASGAFNGDLFLFASATGTIAGWRPALGTTAEILVDQSPFGASYLGLALGTVDGGARLYAANFGNARIDAFSSPGTPVFEGAFTDPALPAGYAPFNIQNLGGSLFVTYAKVGPTGEEETGLGKGFVDKFDLRGNFISRLVSNAVLDAPWGLAIAPAGFGPFGGNLLAGNFGDGKINAFDITTGALVGTLLNAQSQPIVNEGLWGLTFGNGGNGGNPGTLYFAAGVQDETHGLFGSISPTAAAGIPDSASTAVLAAIAALGLFGMNRLLRTSGVD